MSLNIILIYSSKDAVFLSPHKFVGGVATPGENWPLLCLYAFFSFSQVACQEYIALYV